MVFVTEQFKADILNSVKSEYPKLNASDATLISRYLVDIVDLIGIKFNFDDNMKKVYETQFIQNGYQDLKSLMNLLLPFVNDARVSKKEITSFNDLYKKKVGGKFVDINKGEPNYEFTNIQYGRSTRIETGNEEINFSPKHLEHNFYLLRDSINMVANKLYVNWIDVTPVSLLKEDYQNLPVYSATKDAITNLELRIYDAVTDENRSYSGLQISDIYNVMANNFFYHIKSVKWLLYELKIGKTTKPYIEILQQLLPKFFLERHWNRLSEKEQELFGLEWDNLIKKNDQDKYIRIVLRVLTIFFDKKHKDLKDTTYRKIQQEIDDSNDENLMEDASLDEQIFASLRTISGEMVYNYLYDSINQFRNTWYGKKMFSDGNFSIPILESKNGVTLTLKNIYNFAKSLISYTATNGDFVQHGSHWRSINTADKMVILSRLNSPSGNWFKIYRYIRNIKGLSGNDVLRYNLELYKIIRNNLADIIFETLIMEGVLSRFIPNPSISDKNRLPDEYKQQQKAIIERMQSLVFDKYKQQWDNSYHFLSGKKYGKMEMFLSDGKFNYLEAMRQGIGMGAWYTTYAMNWISQIGFFHKYLNNRIIYITGSTGVGKSSQIPKLLLYAQKAIDYEYRGRIIGSQPRIPAVSQNVNTISKQMGVPIQKHIKYFGDIDSDNYYIQFQHSRGRHTKDRTDHPVLKVATDGLLYQEIRKSPLLKKQDGVTNSYNIVIVDEAHEHNKNMDLILTIMRYALYYNNSLKLVIVSATMDSDEPTYRRFYRDINDNRMYPWNHLIIDHKLDRINVDRRFHISPPGASTRFHIEDIYEPTIEKDQIDDLVVRIATTSVDGDMLLFRPGVKEIQKSVEYLNRNLPPNFIALPFYKDMNRRKLAQIESLNDKFKNKLIIPRYISFAEEIADEDLPERVPKGTYNRVVIVATNLAEASITINTLRYVIDTGIEKSGEYSFKNRDAPIKSRLISESSKMQRRGRVGRVAPGTVYYLYSEDAMKGVKKAFSFANDDISEDLLGLLRESADEKPLFSELNDPNRANISSESSFPGNLGKMIKKQYFDKDMFIIYRGVDDQYDYINAKKPKTYFETGYSDEILKDKSGDFYIVHPDETLLKRNISGKIVDILDADSLELNNNLVKSYKIETFWQISIERLYCFEEDGVIKRTEFGNRLMGFSAKLLDLDIELKDVITYLYGRKYGVADEIIQIISMKKTLGNSLGAIGSTTFQGKKKVSSIETLRGIYGDNYGDVSSIQMITKRILERFRIPGPDRYREMMEINKKKYLSGNFRGMDWRSVSVFTNLDHNNRLKHKDVVTDVEKKELMKENVHIRLIDAHIRKNREEILSWSKENHLNYDEESFKIGKFIYVYNRMKNDFENFEGLDWFDENLKIPEIPQKPEDRLLCSFLHGYGENIAKRIEGNNLFVALINPSPDNVYEIESIKKTKIKATMTKYQGEYVMFLNKSRSFSQLGFINNVDPALVQKIVPFIYSIDRFSEENYRLDRHKEAINFLFDNLGPYPPNLKNHLVGEYLETIKKIKQDMVNNFDPNIYRVIKEISQNGKFIDNYLNRQLSMKRGQTGGGEPFKRCQYKFNPYIKHILKKYHDSI